MHRTQDNLVLVVCLDALVGTRIGQDAGNAPLPIHGNRGVMGIQIHLALAVHIIVLSRRPLQDNTRGKAVVGMAETVEQIRVERGDDGRLGRIVRLAAHRLDRRCLRIDKLELARLGLYTPVYGETHVQRQAVDYFPRMAQAEVEVLEIIQVYLVEVEDTVRDGLQIFQNTAVVDTVTVANVDVEGSPLLGQVAEVGIYGPIKLLAREVVTDLGHDAQQLVPREEPTVLELLAIGETIRTAVADQQGIDQRRATHAPYLVQPEGIVADEHVAHLSPELQRLLARTLLLRHTVQTLIMLPVQRPLFLGQVQRPERVERGGVPDKGVCVTPQDV